MTFKQLREDIAKLPVSDDATVMVYIDHDLPGRLVPVDSVYPDGVDDDNPHGCVTIRTQKIRATDDTTANERADHAARKLRGAKWTPGPND